MGESDDCPCPCCGAFRLYVSDASGDPGTGLTSAVVRCGGCGVTVQLRRADDGGGDGCWWRCERRSAPGARGLIVWGGTPSTSSTPAAAALRAPERPAPAAAPPIHAPASARLPAGILERPRPVDGGPASSAPSPSSTVPTRPSGAHYHTASSNRAQNATTNTQKHVSASTLSRINVLTY